MAGSLNANAGPRYRHRADESAPYETITLDKLTPILGAEISGSISASRCPTGSRNEIHRALAENLVIFFRDQHISLGTALGLRPPVRRPATPIRRRRASPASPS